ncbi:acyl carrier protein 2, mitochondrial-like [Silene latifolia]|uniref:acyl carrier protein 2, mitochondrial-like n=1 Tax=Silene latifolia TaxID=37657 RepID=UPI003D77E7BB
MATMIRSSILKLMRVTIAANHVFQNPRSSFSVSSAINNAFFRRQFSTSEEVRGSFLDKSEVTDRVLSVVKNFQKIDPSKVTTNAHFQKDLGLDSLDTVEIVMALEEEFRFEIPDNEADKISSINMAVDFIASHPQAK